MKIFALTIFLYTAGFNLLSSAGHDNKHNCGHNQYYHCDFSGRPCECRPK